MKKLRRFSPEDAQALRDEIASARYDIDVDWDRMPDVGAEVCSIESAHITPVGGNVFADLGFEPTEAAALQSTSQARLARELKPTPEE